MCADIYHNIQFEILMDTDRHGATLPTLTLGSNAIPPFSSFQDCFSLD